MIVTRVAHNRLPEDVLSKRCDDLGMIYEGRSTENQRTYVLFRCPKHYDKGQQRAAWYHFRNCSNGCAYCCGKYKTTEDFIKEVAALDPDILITGEYNGARKKIDCECMKCGNKFRMVPNAILCGQGCPECGKRTSRGEKRIMRYLQDNDIKYIHGYGFDDCKYIKTLQFDFYLPCLSATIEFDGIQHFQVVNFRGAGLSDLESYQKRDKIKDEYCITHGIRMIRISYEEYDDIEKILDQEINTIRSSETVQLPMVT